LTSPLSCKTTIHDGGTSYTKEFGEATEFGNTWILKLRDIFGYKGPGSWEVEPDASLYPVDITMTAEDSGTTITNTI